VNAVPFYARTPKTLNEWFYDASSILGLEQNLPVTVNSIEDVFLPETITFTSPVLRYSLTFQLFLLRIGNPH
jgi:hypothetical protein